MQYTIHNLLDVIGIGDEDAFLDILKYAEIDFNQGNIFDLLDRAIINNRLSMFVQLIGHCNISPQDFKRQYITICDVFESQLNGAGYSSVDFVRYLIVDYGLELNCIKLLCVSVINNNLPVVRFLIEDQNINIANCGPDPNRDDTKSIYNIAIEYSPETFMYLASHYNLTPGKIHEYGLIDRANSNLDKRCYEFLLQRMRGF